MKTLACDAILFYSKRTKTYIQPNVDVHYGNLSGVMAPECVSVMKGKG